MKQTAMWCTERFSLTCRTFKVDGGQEKIKKGGWLSKLEGSYPSSRRKREEGCFSTQIVSLDRLLEDINLISWFSSAKHASIFVCECFHCLLCCTVADKCKRTANGQNICEKETLQIHPTKQKYARPLGGPERYVSALKVTCLKNRKGKHSLPFHSFWHKSVFKNRNFYPTSNVRVIKNFYSGIQFDVRQFIDLQKVYWSRNVSVCCSALCYNHPERSHKKCKIMRVWTVIVILLLPQFDSIVVLEA